MFNLSNVSVGDTVNVHGFESPAGSGSSLPLGSSATTEHGSEVSGPFTAGTSPQFSTFGHHRDAFVRDSAGCWRSDYYAG